MSGGVFAVSRGIFDDPDYAPEPFTQREAVMWLVASAAWKERAIRGARGRVTLQRGEFCFSVRFLAERWQWSKSRVARFLSVLENRDTIRDAKRDGEQVWFIPKYNDFQRVSLPKRDSDRDSEWDAGGTAAGHERDKEEDREIQDNKPSLRSGENTAHPREPIDEPIAAEAEPPPKPKPKRKASRLPEDWQPPDEFIAFAISEGFTEQDAYREADQFRDYWTSRSRDAARIDWFATWRNRIRDLVDRRKPRTGGRLAGQAQAGRKPQTDGLLDAAIRNASARRTQAGLSE